MGATSFRRDNIGQVRNRSWSIPIEVRPIAQLAVCVLSPGENGATVGECDEVIVTKGNRPQTRQLPQASGISALKVSVETIAPKPNGVCFQGKISGALTGRYSASPPIIGGIGSRNLEA